MLNTDNYPFTTTNMPQQDEGPQQQQCVHQQIFDLKVKYFI